MGPLNSPQTQTAILLKTETVVLNYTARMVSSGNNTANLGPNLTFIGRTDFIFYNATNRKVAGSNPDEVDFFQ
jgi:hypothetical protein